MPVTVGLKGFRSRQDALGALLEADGPHLTRPVTVLIDTDPVHEDRCGEIRFDEEGGRCIAKGTSISCR